MLRDIHTLVKQEFNSEQFNAVWVRGCCLGACRTVAKCFTEGLFYLQCEPLLCVNVSPYSYIVSAYRCVVWGGVGQEQDAGTEFH